MAQVTLAAETHVCEFERKFGPLAGVTVLKCRDPKCGARRVELEGPNFSMVDAATIAARICPVTFAVPYLKEHDGIECIFEPEIDGEGIHILTCTIPGCQNRKIFVEGRRYNSVRSNVLYTALLDVGETWARVPRKDQRRRQAPKTRTRRKGKRK